MRVLLMHPREDLDLERPLPPHAAALIQDMELATLFDAMALGDDLLHEIARKVVLASKTDPAIICYRQEVLKDCIENPEVVRAIHNIPIDLLAKKRQNLWYGIYSSTPSGILFSALKMMELFVVHLRQLRDIADQHAHRFASPGFRAFFAMIERELDDAYFSAWKSTSKSWGSAMGP
jgi:hypothetical protein